MRFLRILLIMLLLLTINPQLFYDMIQLEIRGDTIKYSSQKKKDANKTQDILLHRLEELEAHSGELSHESELLLQSSRRELETIFQLEAEGAAVRSRAKYNLNGEKPSRMFCALEKYNGTQKFIPQLVVEENGVSKTLTTQSAIESETKNFYTKLYSNHDHFVTETIETFLGQSAHTVPRLSQVQSESMGDHITVEEMK